MAQILDQFGRPVSAQKKPESRVMAAASIADRYEGYPADGLTPGRLAAIFRAADAGDVRSQAELFTEMEERDAHLAAELLKRKNAVRALDYNLLPYEEGLRKPGKSGAKSREIVDWCSDALFSMGGFEDALFDLLDAVGKGYAACEIHWEAGGGQVIPVALSWIPSTRLVFVESVIPRLITDAAPMGEEIPTWKVLYHRHRAKSGEATRAGLLRVCAWSYLIKNYSVKDWATFAEICGIPLRLGKYDPGASEAEKNALKIAVQTLGSAAAGIISKSTEIQFLEAAGTGSSSPHEALAGFCDRQMSKAILGGTLTSDAGDKGSYALGKTHNEVRKDLVRSDGWALANTLREGLLRPMVGFRYGWDAPVPWFMFDLSEPEDLGELMTVYKGLHEMGQPLSVRHISERFGSPLPGEGEAVLGQGEAEKISQFHLEYGIATVNEVRASLGLKPIPGGDAPPKPFVPQQSAAVPGAAKAAGKAGPGGVAEGEPGNLLAILEARTNAEADIGPLLAPVRELLAQAESLEDFRDRLIGCYGQMEVSGLADVLARAFALADLTGRFTA